MRARPCGAVYRGVVLFRGVVQRDPSSVLKPLNLARGNRKRRDGAPRVSAVGRIPEDRAEGIGVPCNENAAVSIGDKMLHVIHRIYGIAFYFVMHISFEIDRAPVNPGDADVVIGMRGYVRLGK